MDRPIVSVIVPAYNSEIYIEETLRSVANQLFKNFEAIVVDDGSTDGQQEIIMSFCEADSRFRYIYQENKGVAASRNAGFNHSSGQYIAFLDADDVWLPNNLSTKLEKFESGDFGLVHSDASLMDGNSVGKDGFLIGKEGDLLVDMLKWNGTQVPGPSSILLKRTVIQKVGLFDTNLSTSADHEFFLRVAKYYSIGRVPTVTWKYRLHGSNMHKVIPLMEHDLLYLYEKASANKLFGNFWFERMCYATMYLILAASWAGDGNNKFKASHFTILALANHPFSLAKIFNRLRKLWT